MLTHLSIQNYALIKDIEVEIQPGFTIITGETGAGKSILLGALSLLLGQRADMAVLRDVEKKCVVEGTFAIEKYGLQELFGELDLDYDHQTIFRREIAPGGKSRAFINDTPVNLKELQQIGLQLIDIHSQHQSLELNNQLFQLKVVDNCAALFSKLKQYQSSYSEFRKLEEQLNEARNKNEKLQNDLDYYQFQFKQLDDASLSENEQLELEDELKVLTHAEEIKSGLTMVSDLLNGDDESALVRIKESVQQLSRLSRFFHEGEDMRQRLDSVYLELKDLGFEIDSFCEKIEYDPSRITLVSERLDLIYSLEQKHHVGSVGELISIRESLHQSILDATNNEEEIERLVCLVNNKQEEVLALARELTLLRRNAVPQIEEQVTEMLYQLGMPNARFFVEISSGEQLGGYGLDRVNFLFTANKNGILNEISKVASGGELSRLMLAIKALISSSKDLPTIIFDEIDTGISGEIADKMANILKDMSLKMQVINITHLPQIAAKGDYHFVVYKEESDNETFTRLKQLNKRERIEEIAKMLSGERLSNAALLNAEELLK